MVGNRNVLKSELVKVKRLVQERENQCWRAIWEDSGLLSPWEVMRWPRNQWSIHRRIGRLQGLNETCLDGNEEKFESLVADMFTEAWTCKILKISKMS